MTILNLSRSGVKTGWPERLQAPRLCQQQWRREGPFGRPKPQPVDASARGVCGSSAAATVGLRCVKSSGETTTWEHGRRVRTTSPAGN